MVKFHFGPAGLGGVKEAISNLEKYKKLGLDACEIAFTYQVYIKKNSDAKKIGQVAKKLGIKLSIHAPYYINLASKDKKKIEASKKRILNCCEKAHWLGAKYVVFHAAYYSGRSEKEIYEIVKKEIIEMNHFIKKKKWKVKLAPETTGKKSQFGSLDELLRLTKETGCFFCVDFAHLLARDGKINYNSVFGKLKKLAHIHSHFSGIVFGAKGEKRHVVTDMGKLSELLRFAKKNHIKDITIINESPDPIGDSIKGLKIASKL
jgi:deoxyribonuclease-4